MRRSSLNDCPYIHIKRVLLNELAYKLQVKKLKEINTSNGRACRNLFNFLAIHGDLDELQTTRKENVNCNYQRNARCPIRSGSCTFYKGGVEEFHAPTSPYSKK